MANQKDDVRRNSTYHYRNWCKYLRTCGLNPRTRGYAKSQWNYYWNGVRDHRLADAAIYLIDTFGY